MELNRDFSIKKNEPNNKNQNKTHRDNPDKRKSSEKSIKSRLQLINELEQNERIWRQLMFELEAIINSTSFPNFDFGFKSIILDISEVSLLFLLNAFNPDFLFFFRNREWTTKIIPKGALCFWTWRKGLEPSPSETHRAKCQKKRKSSFPFCSRLQNLRSFPSNKRKNCSPAQNNVISPFSASYSFGLMHRLLAESFLGSSSFSINISLSLCLWAPPEKSEVRKSLEAFKMESERVGMNVPKNKQIKLQRVKPKRKKATKPSKEVLRPTGSKKIAKEPCVQMVKQFTSLS